MIDHCLSCADLRKFTALYIFPHPGVHTGDTTEYTLARCEKCKGVALFSREDAGEGFEKEPYYRLWPAHSRHISFPLPEIVRQSYEEAVRCENAKAYLAVVVMVRRALEAVTKEYEPTARTLHAGMKAMLTRGIISQELFDWGNQLRVIGNLGAHATSEKIDGQDAIEVIDFLQAMLEILYDLRPKFDKMRARQAVDGSAPIPPIPIATPPASASNPGHQADG